MAQWYSEHLMYSRLRDQFVLEARCSSMVEHQHMVDPISHSSQCFTTGVTKFMVCAVLAANRKM